VPDELTPTNEKDLPLIIHISTHLGRDVGGKKFSFLELNLSLGGKKSSFLELT